MHIYIYDDYVNTKKYDDSLAQIETRITDLGLNGKIIRLGVMKNVQDALSNELKRGANTVIAVGNDKTVNKLINALIYYKKTQAETDVPLGIIPVGEKNNLIAAALGIRRSGEACDVLSARRIETINVARANSHYFLSQATVSGPGTILKIDKDYSIEIKAAGEISVINLPLAAPAPVHAKSSPQDKKLELVIQARTQKSFGKLKTGLSPSLFSLKKITMINEKNPIIIDNALELTGPVEISLAKETLNVIVGKDRNF